MRTSNCPRYILEPGGSHMHLTGQNEVSLEPHSPHKDFAYCMPILDNPNLKYCEKSEEISLTPPPPYLRHWNIIFIL